MINIDSLIPFLEGWVKIFEPIVLIYFLAYNGINFFLLTVAWLRVRYWLNVRSFLHLDEVYNSPTTPPITLIVPAFNEEETIVENINSLMGLRYPRYEIVIVNDGSTDKTMDQMIHHFGFLRRDFGYAPQIPTAPIRGFYEAPVSGSVKRLVLIDKENGGKADSLNAGLNAARSAYVCTLDADSLMDRDTLLQVVQPISLDPQGIFCCGGQVGIANGCAIKNGQIVDYKLPKSWLAQLQVVEYMRSFTAGRTALAHLNSLVILSGVFAVFRRDLLVAVGGFLTRRLNARIAKEYAQNQETVCEDMEIVVRLLRYVYQKKLNLKLLFLPYPITWSQAPERIRDFGRQRNRWYRGLAQVLWIHKSMLFNPFYGRVGLFALPYQFLFEFLGPILEIVSYIVMPLLYWAGLLKTDTFILFMMVSILGGILLSIYAVLMGLWGERTVLRGSASRSLFRYQGLINTLRLIFFAALSMIGYRQVQLLFQMQGFFHFLRGETGWQKFRRHKFQTV